MALEQHNDIVPEQLQLESQKKKNFAKPFHCRILAIDFTAVRLTDHRTIILPESSLIKQGFSLSSSTVTATSSDKVTPFASRNG